jgi:hypothetical protein
MLDELKKYLAHAQTSVRRAAPGSAKRGKAAKGFLVGISDYLSPI